MSQQPNPKVFARGGMNMDDAPENIAANDYRNAFNLRNVGTAQEEGGYSTNIESTEIINSGVHAGLNQTVGANSFESIRKGIAFRYNSFGYNQILVHDFDTDTVQVVYEDLTNSNGAQLLTLNPAFPLQLKLINDTYIVWTDNKSTIGLANLTKLINGDYSTVVEEDLSLIKPQNLIPVQAIYASDNGKAANFIKGKLFQFASRWIGSEYTYSAWSTWSKRIVPDAESTPNVGGSVRNNNCLIVSVNIGSDRVQTIDIAARSGNYLFGIIKSVDRSYVTGLPNTSVDITSDVYESYDPSTNIYSFLFYNDSITVPIAGTEIDLAYDHVPLLADSVENINNNIIALGGITEGYDRPKISANISVTGYDPNLDVPLSANTNPARKTYTWSSGAGSGLGNHVRLLRAEFGGVPHTGDVFKIVLYDIRNASATKVLTYTVPSAFDGNLRGVVQTWAAGIYYAVSYTHDNGITWGIEFRGDPYYEIQSASVALNYVGAAVNKSIHALLDNSSYQLALSFRDKYGRFFPLYTDNSFIIKTPSLAQLLGNTPVIDWTLNTLLAPVGAVDYQWLITKNNTVNNLIDVLGSVINYKGAWDAHANNPVLAINTGTIGDAYQITGPSVATDHRNLGQGEIEFNTGDYVVYNGNTWDLISKTFGDLTSTSDIMVFKINPLLLFQNKYGSSGIDTVLSYDYSAGDRSTLHYYLDGDTPVYINDPCVDVQVLGYDPVTGLVKMEKSADVSLATLQGKDVFLRLYSPKQLDQSSSTAQNDTVWYEIGERYTITNGGFDKITGSITDGDVYYKTRVYQSAIDSNNVKEVLAVDFNFSDFYASAFTSYGRPRTYNDELERTTKKASIRYSENFVLGSKVNGLTRFFSENIYGEQDGQTSSNYGAIKVMWQRNEYLIVLQELKVGYIPLSISIIQQATEQQDIAISEKLFNNIRYNQSGNIGIGNAKESFCYFGNNAWFIDPNRSEPVRIGLDGVAPISDKLSKFFKQTLQAAYALGLKIPSFYDNFYEEVIFSVQRKGSSVFSFAINDGYFDTDDPYNVQASDITNVSTPANTTLAFNPSTGIATYTPSPSFVGNTVGNVTFNTPLGPVTKNICLNWTPGNVNVNPFQFNPLINQQTSTLLYSNPILVSGNNIPVPISVINGEYSINNGSWTSLAGMVNPYDTVQLRKTSAANYGVEVDTTLTVSNQSATWAITTGQPNVQPFAFTNVNNVPFNTLYESNIVTIQITGLNTPVNVSVLSGEYSKNGGAYTSANGTALNGDTFKVRQTSANQDSTATTVSLNVGDKVGTYTVTTGQKAIQPFSFSPRVEQQLGTFIVSDTIQILGNTLPVPISISGGQGAAYSVNGGAFTSNPGNVNPGDFVQIGVLSSANPETDTSATLTVSNQSATFTVSTYHVITIRTHLTEQAVPYSDGNVVVKNNNATITRQTGAGDQTFTNVQSRLALLIAAFSEVPSTGTSPTKTLRIDKTKNGVTTTIYGPTTNSNNPGDPDLSYTESGDDDAVYDIYVSTYASGDAATFGLVNSTGSDLPYSIYADSTNANLVSSGVIPNGQSFNANTLTGTQSLSLTSPLDGKYTLNHLPGNAPYNTIQATQNNVFFSINRSDIAAQQANNYVGINFTFVATPKPVGIMTVDLYDDNNLNVIGFVDTPATTPYQDPAYTGKNFVPAGAAAADAYVLSSDLITGQDRLVRRFEFNVAKLVLNYPQITSFTFRIRGRSSVSETINGQYSLKGAGAGNMIMNGSPGSYIPSTANTQTIGIVPFYNKAVVGGADGTYGLNTGSDILVFVYDVNANTITLQ